ncbi:hypothetical protein BJ742DRAFT_779186 [Cladochytrium replicatum]|nr:hypothetical protein BJ742DRAFT_779186 [Cladochytrium replicatum]
MASVFSTLTALVLCSFFTVIFVGSLYIAQRNLPNSFSRNHPAVIIARFKGIAVAVVLSLLLVAAVCVTSGAFPAYLDTPYTSSDALRLTLRFVGLWPDGAILAAVQCLLVTAALFTGPIVHLIFCMDAEEPNHDGVNKGFRWLDLAPVLATGELTLIDWRNYIVGPAAEELVFRSCVVPILFLSGASRMNIILFSPGFFALAHLHHTYEYYKQNGRNSRALRNGLLIAAFQMTYTTIFGWLSTFLFLRTGHVSGPFISHVFCNYMGVPDIADVISRPLHQRAALLLFYVSGVVLFAFSCVPTTNTPRSIYWQKL